MKAQEIMGLKLKIFCSSSEMVIEKEFNEWVKEHPEYAAEDIIPTACSNYFIVNVFYREPDISKPPYR